MFTRELKQMDDFILSHLNQSTSNFLLDCPISISCLSTLTPSQSQWQSHKTWCWYVRERWTVQRDWNNWNGPERRCRHRASMIDLSWRWPEDCWICTPLNEVANCKRTRRLTTNATTPSLELIQQEWRSSSSTKLFKIDGEKKLLIRRICLYQNQGVCVEYFSKSDANLFCVLHVLLLREKQSGTTSKDTKGESVPTSIWSDQTITTLGLLVNMSQSQRILQNFKESFEIRSKILEFFRKSFKMSKNLSESFRISKNLLTFAQESLKIFIKILQNVKESFRIPKNLSEYQRIFSNLLKNPWKFQ